MLDILYKINGKLEYVEHINHIDSISLPKSDLIEIKKYLEKHSKIMKLLKDLFILLYVGYEFDGYCQDEYYFIREYGPSSSYLISEDLYSILNHLEKLVGDNHE